VAEGKRTYTNKVDIWALGCIIYEISYSRRAFEDDYSVSRHFAKKRKLPFVDQVCVVSGDGRMAIAHVEGEMKDAIEFNIKDLLAQNPQARPSASTLYSRFKDIVLDRSYTELAAIPQEEPFTDYVEHPAGRLEDRKFMVFNKDLLIEQMEEDRENFETAISQIEEKIENRWLGKWFSANFSWLIV